MLIGKTVLVLTSLTAIAFAFQNCQQKISMNNNSLSSSTAGSLIAPGEVKDCIVGNVNYKTGDKWTGFSLYSVMAPAVCGEKVERTCLPSGEFDGPTPLYETCTQLSQQSNAIDALPAGEWMEIPNSQVSQVFPTNSPGGGPYAVVAAWSGGAFDTKRDRMILWGGGHADYAGNEIYVFDLNTLKWTRVNEPSVVPGDISQFSTGYYPDGNPVSRHTYNYIQYLPDPVDRFCTFGGAAFWKSGQYGSSHTDCFNFDKNMWEVQKFPDTPSATIGANSAYDPVTATLWHHGGYGDVGLSSLNTKTGQWTKLWGSFSGAGDTLGYNRTSDIDPINRKMVAVGAGKVLVWDLTKPGLNYATEIKTTGPQDIVVGAGGSPGFVYVPELKAFVGWSGGANIYKFDLLTMNWSTMPLSINSAATPPAEQKNWGTFGRLRYSAKKKVLVLVDGHDQNVLVYKVK